MKLVSDKRNPPLEAEKIPLDGIKINKQEPGILSSLAKNFGPNKNLFPKSVRGEKDDRKV